MENYPVNNIDKEIDPPSIVRADLEEVCEEIYQLISSDSFKIIARNNLQDFTRERILTFPVTFEILINRIKTSTQISMNRYFEMIGQPLTVISQQAFSKARKKIRWEACQLLSEKVVEIIYSHGFSTWKGFRLLAIDGSKVQLPDDKALELKYGTAGRGRKAPSAQSSCLYDVLNGNILHAILAPMSCGERVLAVQHLNFLEKMKSFNKELLLCDRGYPSNDFLFYCQSKNINFVMRLKTKFNREIDDMPLGSHIFEINNDEKKVIVRVVKLKLVTGETETLLTDIFDDTLTLDDFRDLYFKRWKIETQYCSIKHKFQIENFSGILENCILQDYYLEVMLYNIIALSALQIQPTIDNARKGMPHKYKYKMNLNHAVGTFKNHLIFAIFTDLPELRLQILNYIFFHLVEKLTPIRLGRSIPRPLWPREANFRHNQKAHA
jgi:hypothetical protein